jgi:hypothetical protein
MNTEEKENNVVDTFREMNGLNEKEEKKPKTLLVGAGPSSIGTIGHLSRGGINTAIVLAGLGMAMAEPPMMMRDDMTLRRRRDNNVNAGSPCLNEHCDNLTNHKKGCCSPECYQMYKHQIKRATR